MSLREEVESDAISSEVDALEKQLLKVKAVSEERRKEIEKLRRFSVATETENDKLRSALDLVDSITVANPVVPKWIQPKKNPKKHTGTPVLMLSDLHLDEVVNPDEVQGINGYNREIAEMRLTKVIDSTVDVLQRYVAGLEFDGFVLALGGDIMTGDIHEELQQTNHGTIMEGVVHWVPQLASAIDHIASELDVPLFIPCVRGNHDRYSKKKPSKKSAQESFSWIIYHWLADHFRDDDRVQFAISPSADYSFPVYNTDFVLTHGDQFGGGGGIAGIYCLGEDTKVLTSGMSWKELGSLEIGSSIVGFDEDPNGPGEGRKFRESEITSCDTVYLDSCIVKTDIGETLASNEHMWLVRKNHNVVWVTTDRLEPGDNIMSVGSPWEQDNSRDAGWLAGIYDGEGSIHDGRLSVSQNEGPVLDKVLTLLRDRNYDFSIQRSMQSDCFNVRSSNGKAMTQNMRLLGSIGSERLDMSYLWKNNSTKACTNSVVQSVTPVGKQKLVAVGTSTKTLVANGLLSHNSPIMRGQYKKQQRNASLGTPFDYMIMGHFHQLIYGQKIIVNGSLKGYDEYAFDHNFEYEKAKQALWIVTPENGITHQMPIFAESENEPWKTKKKKVSGGRTR